MKKKEKGYKETLSKESFAKCDPTLRADER